MRQYIAPVHCDGNVEIIDDTAVVFVLSTRDNDVVAFEVTM